MTLHAKVAGVWRDITDPTVRVGGVDRDVSEGWVKVSGVWERFFNAVTAATVDVQPGSVSGTGSGNGDEDVTSDAATGTVSNGAGPFNYQWAYVSGEAVTIDSPNLDATTFTESLLPAGVTKSSVYELTVTDTGNGNATSSDTVNVTLSN